MSTHTAARPGILTLALADKQAVHAAYMPWLKSGGVFVPLKDREKVGERAYSYQLGDEVFVLLTLPESSGKLPLAGKVVWITPKGAGHREAGIGVQFPENDEGEQARRAIENLLAGVPFGDKPTHTM